MRLSIRLFLGAIRLAALAFTVSAWWVPIDVRQHRAALTAGSAPFERFEAEGFAEALWWLLRVAGPVVFAVSCLAWRRLERVTRFLATTTTELASATFLGNDSAQPDHRRSPISTWIVRLFVVGWFFMAIYHVGGSLVQRLNDWPAYRLTPGEQMLPNVSASNRQVIRYLRQSTPPNARILVLSDQKLFFVSYYALPRRVFHPMHPDSEFAIPLAHGESQMAAYRFDDLDADFLAKINPDYVLEYFEGDAYIDPARVEEDANWIRFLQTHNGPDFRPTIHVALRPYTTRERP